MADFAQIITLIQTTLRLPFWKSLPGSVLEEILAHVYGGRRTGTYDFVDVVNDVTRTGWQVKSTRHATPVTWKRVKLPNKGSLIERSHATSEGTQTLGNAIVDSCNSAAKESIEKYKLKSIKYARLVDHMNGRLTYFERVLPISGQLFEPRHFRWCWSKAKTAKKEQLPAFHGVHVDSDDTWFAWHGRGENQLHFKGEKLWWPAERGHNRRDFVRSGDNLTMTELADMITDHAPKMLAKNVSDQRRERGRE